MSDAPASSSDSPPSNLKQDKVFSKATNPLAAAKRSSDPKTFSKMPSWREIGTPSEPFFNVAILIDDINVMDSHASAMSKPASRCYLTNVVVLNSTSDDPKQVQESVKEWLRMNKIDVDVEDLDIGQGLVGYTEMLKQLEIDAVYIVFYQKDYILQALTAKKHVLVNDPISTLLPEYLETLECAKKNGVFIQSSTMFVFQSRVQRFMNRVLQDDHFGRITE
ncbi:MAG: hypothetical protein SGILL_000001, partial [Bacillariaceae sp.]